MAERGGRDHLEPVFAALADPTRRAVVAALAQGGAASATQLAGRFPVTRQAIAKHLQVLSDAGLVASTRAGREVQWSVTPRPLADAAAWMAEVGGQWDRRLEALGRLLARPSDTPCD
jgi:DNA-binding transcriptional ArsR family regulator